MVRRILQPPLMPLHWRAATFEKVAPPNCRRYYRIELEHAPDGWRVVTHRGRIGGTTRPLVEVRASLEEAEVLAKKRAHDRFLHGYSLTDVSA